MTSGHDQEHDRLEQAHEQLQLPRRALFQSIGDVEEDVVQVVALFADRHHLDHVAGKVVASAQRRRQGIGRLLVQELLDLAQRDGKHAVIAGIDADNHPSLRMHEQLGFQQVGRLPEIARKFDRWLDLVFMQLLL